MSIFRKKKTKKDDPLLLELAKTKIELETAYSNFENVTDPDLIDSSIYEVNAVQQRYKYLPLDFYSCAAAAASVSSDFICRRRYM